MSQPEMQPEGASQEGPDDRRDDRRSDRPSDGWSEGAGPWAVGPELTGRPFPAGDWGEPAEQLEELYRWVERGALETAAWYLADRVW
ncbi:SLATT domain-containing protein, partial [Streptomyces phyllanthi]